MKGRSVDRATVAVLWRRIEEVGSEYCTLSPTAFGWRLRGTACTACDGRPACATYRIDCTSRWETRRVLIDLAIGGEVRALRIAADAAHRWWRDGIELVDLRGCVDVDLGITPATNTLPIRRTALSIGDSIAVPAAWVRFPDLSIEVLAQRYTRLAPDRYRYESLASGFTADLTVDAQGLVLAYPGAWERAPMPPGRRATSSSA